MNRLFHFSLLLAAISLFATGDAVSQNLDEMRFELLDEEDGLSNHWIARFALDSSGFLWIGANDGLNRYDGHTFKVFRHDEKDPRSLLDDSGHSLYVDKKGRLWIGYWDGSIGVFDHHCQCFTNYTDIGGADSPIHPGSAYLLSVEEDGSVWFSGVRKGLNIFYPESGELIHFDLPNIHPGYPERDLKNYNSIFDIHKTSDGLHWLATANGLYTFDLETSQFTYLEYEPIDPRKARSDYFNCIMPEGDKGLWLSAWAGGVSYYDLASGKFSNYKYAAVDFNASIGNIVADIAIKSEDEFWIGTEDKGLCIFNKKSRTFQVTEHFPQADEEISSKVASQILVAPEGVIFLLNNDGLLKFSPYARLFHFKPLAIAKSQNNNAFNIKKIIEDPENQAIYFATELGNGLNVMDMKTGKLTPLPVDIDPSSIVKYQLVKDMLLDRQGRLWVLSRDYMYEYDKRNKRLLKVVNPFSADEYLERATFSKIAEDSDGDIWVVTAQGGLHQFFPEKRALSPMLNKIDASTSHPRHVTNLAFDKNRRIWLEGGGQICAYDKKTRQFLWPLSEEVQELALYTSRSMAADLFGNIWVVITRKGLLKIDTQDPEKPITRFLTTTDGLPSFQIHNMNIDPEGNIWMSTVKGVVYMNTQTMSYRVFNQTAGMDKNTIYMQFSSDKNGSFYITTPGRYCKVDLAAVNRTAPLPTVYIDKFSVLNKEKLGQLLPNTAITIRPGENFFSFDFGCIDFSNQALNQFAYMLEGWDNDWVYCGTRRFASYTNLNGGKYVFRVKVANSEGVWGDPISVPVHIETPFYQKTWFSLLVALLFSGLIYGLYLYRVRQIEHTERLKTEFNKQIAETRLQALRAQMNPHFIFNCLNSINRYIIKSDIKTSSLYLTRFAKLIRLILDNSEHKRVALSSDLEALRLYIEMESLRFDHKFTFDIEVDETVDADNVEVPPLIIQPYVENAIWHGLLHRDSGGHLSVRLSQQNGTLSCVVADNGVGRVKAIEYKSLNAPTRKSVGMKLTEERLGIAGEDFSSSGSYKIIDLYDDDGQPLGTKVIIHIPV